MLVKTFLGKRTAAIVVTAIVGLGVAACAPPPPAGGGSPSDPYTASLFSSLNADRAANGLPALSWNSQLGDNASSWARQMGNAGSLYHQNLGALIGSPSYAGFNTLGENILVGPAGMSAPSVESAWINSPPHRANITSRSFNVVGIGYYQGPGGQLWAAQEFGGV